MAGGAGSAAPSSLPYYGRLLLSLAFSCSSEQLSNPLGVARQHHRLVAGVTTLGDELSLVYRQDQIAASAFAAMLTWTWNGAAFAP